MNIGCVVMAAGRSLRFGSNKLLAELEGKTLIDRALDAVPVDRLAQTVVVSATPNILSRAASRGFTPILNDRPEAGLSRTVRLGTEALLHCDAILYMVADQPLLARETVAGEVDEFLRSPGRIVMLGAGERRGNPSIFPKEYFSELTHLHGDEGGVQVVKAHPRMLALHPAREIELCDVDSVEALELMKKVSG